MSEERTEHPGEPAEGSEQDVGAPGAGRSENDTGSTENTGDETWGSEHPTEPAEGGEDEVEAPGAERARDGG
jgi:hypothetical protein